MTPRHRWDTHLFKGIQQIAYCLLLVQLLHPSLLLWHRHGDWEERQGGEGQEPSRSSMYPDTSSGVTSEAPVTPGELQDGAIGSHRDVVLPPQHSPCVPTWASATRWILHTAHHGTLLPKHAPQNTPHKDTPHTSPHLCATPQFTLCLSEAPHPHLFPSAVLPILLRGSLQTPTPLCRAALTGTPPYTPLPLDTFPSQALLYTTPYRGAPQKHICPGHPPIAPLYRCTACSI